MLSLFAQAPAEKMDQNTIITGITIVAVIVGIAVILIVFAVFARFFRWWIQSLSTGAGIGIFDLVGMTFRKVNPAVIVGSKIMAVQAGISDKQGATSKALEAHYLAGGNVPLVIRSLIAANKAKLDLDYKLATAIDLAGRNVLESVQTSVNPKVIDCPGGRAVGKDTLDGIAQNGIQLKVKARVTVRTNIRRLVGGATEETVVARVGEGIVNAIGSALDYKHVLKAPDSISKTVLNKGLDANTAFDILSIDIAEIKVGENIGAKLAADRAESDKRRFQAEAEQRRAMAVAQEQENVAQQAANRATVILAEAEIPKAMAEAFRSGHMGIMDYYRMKNIQADTAMRDSISKPTEK